MFLIVKSPLAIHVIELKPKHWTKKVVDKMAKTIYSFRKPNPKIVLPFQKGVSMSINSMKVSSDLRADFDIYSDII